MNEKKIYQQAVKKFGSKKQLIKTIEELSELQKELCKLLLNPHHSRDKIAEEIADVEIMLPQARIILDEDSRVDIWKSQKLSKMVDRLNGE